ncbi:hypothetical protein B5T_03248 [Alloalcanivorax dieselolei B5]|uniref:Uncharacterized protein n=1 Tax=Alcanivorax dieselolei (strain DSM 16502 / CGMCC 1.3690 / MCCC 1A00001 / B-5) TaxID=930169 RepID=K0CGJ6_ALCDB|nr:hypothetical protein [Alloalcanivorax dieselolei]AFT71515.1 hypothetical protein B5T_03248 [Alloalcanivorax dieselolei B5]GGJ90282.1 hypothetical protein GCM10007426_19330 [Alloalcanivorax dieselolei]
MKRILLVLASILLLIPITVVLALTITRDVPGGTYFPQPINSKFDSYAEVTWAEVDRLLPVMRLYGPDGTKLRSYLMVPFKKEALPLRGHGKEYVAETDGSVRFIQEEGLFGNSYPDIKDESDLDALKERSKDNLATDINGIQALKLVPVEPDNPELLRIQAEWRDARNRTQEVFQQLAQAKVTPTWQTSHEGMLSLKLPENYVLRYPEAASDAIAFKVWQRRGTDVKAHQMTLFATTNEDKYQRRKVAKNFFSIHPDHQNLGHDIHIAREANGYYFIQAERDIGDTYIHARAETPDTQVASDFIGIIKQLGTEDLSMQLLSGEYIPSMDSTMTPKDYAEFVGFLGQRLDPFFNPDADLFHGRSNRMTSPDHPWRLDFFSFDQEGAASIQIFLLRWESANPPALQDIWPHAPAEEEYGKTVATAGPALKLRINPRRSTCNSRYHLPITRINEHQELSLLFDVNSNSLPECQEAAAWFKQLDLAALKKAIPAINNETAWRPFFQNAALKKP